MTLNGTLEHEGSSVPNDPRAPSASEGATYVLDIGDMALQPRSMPLKVRKKDPRRRSTQTWSVVNVRPSHIP